MIEPKVIYLRDDSNRWQPIGGLISWSFNEDVEVLDTTYKTTFETCITDRQKYAISLNAISNDVDFENVKNLKESSREIEWKIGDEYGRGYFNSVQVEDNVNEVVEWSAEIVNEGKPLTETEINTKSVYGQLPVYVSLLANLISPRDFWYMRGIMQNQVSLIGVLSRFIDTDELQGAINVNVGLSAELTEEIIYTLLDATYESAFDFAGYYQKVYSEQGASVEDVQCFQDAIFKITRNGGMLLNTTIVSSLLSEVIFAEISGNLNVDVDITAEMIKTKIFTDIEGVLNQATQLSASLSKEKIFTNIEGVIDVITSLNADLDKTKIFTEIIGNLLQTIDLSADLSKTSNDVPIEGNIEIVVDPSGDLSKTKIYTDIEGDLNITISIDGDIEVTSEVNTYAIDNQGYTTSNSSCSAILPNNSVYSDDATLSIGSVIYTNTTLTNTFNGGNLWYKIGLGNTYRINFVGQIIDITTCSDGFP